jgi:hypothetical protein
MSAWEWSAMTRRAKWIAVGSLTVVAVSAFGFVALVVMAHWLNAVISLP